ncbi:unnamed protein product, partial [marine sediment metagenome]
WRSATYESTLKSSITRGKYYQRQRGAQLRADCVPRPWECDPV